MTTIQPSPSGQSIAKCAPPVPFCIIVHAGAGRHDPRKEDKYRACIKAALLAAHRALAAGESSLDACVAAVACMEDDACCNAGFGSNLTEDGTVECDAAVMDGRCPGFGACGAVAGVCNPVRLAARLLERQREDLPRPLGRVPPMLLVGSGAHRWAREQNLLLVPPSQLVSDGARAAWRRYSRWLREEEARDEAREEEAEEGEHARRHDAANTSSSTRNVGASALPPAKRRRVANERDSSAALESVESVLHDTVGAVVCVGRHVASAVSSGGVWLKHCGRVGEAACFGAGCWAKDGADERAGTSSSDGGGSAGLATASVAVSVSGVGEEVMARLLARQVGVALAPADALAAEVGADVLRTDTTEDRGCGFVALRCLTRAGAAGAPAGDHAPRIEWVAAHSTPSMAWGVLSTHVREPRCEISRRADADGAVPRVLCASA